MRAVLLCAALAATACGDSPEAPSRAVFPDGIYRLEIGFALRPLPPGTIKVCAFFGRDRASLDIQMTSQPDGWRIQMPHAVGPGSGTMHGELTVSGTHVTAFLRGAAIDAGGVRVVFGSDRMGDVALAGTGYGTYASGDLTGALSIDNASVGGDCTLEWTLALR